MPALVVLGSLAWVLVIHGETTLAMATIWWRSETFAHGFVIVPIVLYLLWRERAAIASIVPRPYWPALAGLIVLGGLWLVAVRLGVNSVAQFSVIAMIPCSILAVLGTRALRTLAFPLAFLFFAVPFGEFLMPALMDWTANVTIAALRASGIPVYREGNYFMIPSGRWSVVEACSGLRYLIASFMVGCLFAYLSFRSPVRRVIFVLVSIVVPILANWIRAYMIVMLGHLSNNRIAAGADHLVYGWVFFGVVMAVLFWIGARWREDMALSPQREPAMAPASARRTTARALGATFALIAAFPLLAAFETRGLDRNDAQLPLIAGSNGWNSAPGALSEWRPDIAGATSWQVQTFTKDGASVALIIAYYSGAASPKAITSTNQLVRTVNKQWEQIAVGTAEATGGGTTGTVRTALVVGGRQRLAVWQWYWVGGRVTSSDLTAKFYQALGVLRGVNDSVAWVVIATPTDRSEDDVRPILSRFAADMQSAIDAALRSAASKS
jgi:exosortase A